MARYIIPGSKREQSPSPVTGPVSSDQTARVSVILRRQQMLPSDVVQSGSLTGGDLAKDYGASQADIDALTEAATKAGLTVAAVHPESRTVKLEGPAEQLAKFFGTTLQAVESGGMHTRARSGELSVPSSLGGIVTAVLGLDDRPAAQPRLAKVRAEQVSTSFTPVQLATIYGMPQADGTGQVIAIIELGGGFKQSDLKTYFTGLGLKTPKVTAVGVDGASNAPEGNPDGADGEVLLDIEVAGAIAPKALIKVYFGPNTDAGFLDAVAAATHANPTPASISISWGQSEDQWTAQARQAMDDAFADAAALGITVTAAAGDSGSGDSDTSTNSAGKKVHADFPAASPHVLGCGGTSLQVDGTTVTSETVWHNPGGGATGGGVSDTFALPDWQAAVGVPKLGTTTGRGVPDVAAVADPATGYQVQVDGQKLVFGGTSAVAPLWAALVARLAQLTGQRLGLIQRTLYAGLSKGKTSLRDITNGSNGAYKARAGWDACTGLGVPDAGVASLFKVPGA